MKIDNIEEEAGLFCWYRRHMNTSRNIVLLLLYPTIVALISYCVTRILSSINYVSCSIKNSIKQDNKTTQQQPCECCERSEHREHREHREPREPREPRDSRKYTRLQCACKRACKRVYTWLKGVGKKIKILLTVIKIETIRFVIGDQIKIYPSAGYAVISYYYCGQIKQMLVDYDQSKLVSQSSIEMKYGSLDITNFPGVPYSFHSKCGILCTHLETGRSVIYTDNIVPYFCSDLLEDEKHTSTTCTNIMYNMMVDDQDSLVNEETFDFPMSLSEMSHKEI